MVQLTLFDRCCLQCGADMRFNHSPYNTNNNVNGFLPHCTSGYPNFCQTDGTNIGNVNRALIQRCVQELATRKNVIFEIMNEPGGAFSNEVAWHKWVADVVHESYDMEAPSVPTNVQASALSPGSIQVTWTASTDNIGVTGYKIFRGGSQVGTSTTTSFTNSGLQPNTTYSYTVLAYDAAGNESAQSSPPVVATTLADTEAPSIPADVQATALSTDSIKLTWQGSTDNLAVAGYKIYCNAVLVATYEPPSAPAGSLIGPFVPGTGNWNTLYNGGWELGNTDGWSYQYGTTYGTYVATQAMAAVGDWSLKSAMNTSASTGLVLRRTNLSFVVGQQYVFSGFFYTGTFGSGDTYLDLYATDAWQGLYLTTIPMGVGEWQFCWKVWTADRTTADLRILRQKTAGQVDGGIYCDEIACTPISEFALPMELITYTDSGLAPGTTYSYTVSAYDASANESAQSSPPAVAMTQGGVDTEPPSVPTDVTATAQSGSQILVEWTASIDNVGITGYRVFRNGSEVGTTGGSTSYTDSGLQDATTYSYTVSAYDAAGNESAQSSPPAVATTLDTTPPSVPTNVEASAVSHTSVQVTWTASTDNVGVTGYKVYRDGSQIGTSDTVSYTDTSLEANTTYSYRVSAYDLAGNDSTESSPAAVVATMSAPGAGQRGITGGVGLNTIGLLVGLWGAYTYVDESTFLINDGGTPIECVVTSGVTLDPNWQYVAVIGISSCYKSGDDLIPLIKVRSGADITPF